MHNFFSRNVPITGYRRAAPVYTQFLDRSISASQSVSRSSVGHVQSARVQPIKCMLFILIYAINPDIALYSEWSRVLGTYRLVL